MKYVSEESKDTEINYFNLKDNNDIQVMECGYINMETRPRTDGTIYGVDVYTVVDAMKQRVIRMHKKRSAANKLEVIHYLNFAEEAMRKCKDNRIFRGEQF